MANRRLNKKVALIGSSVAALLLLAVIGLILHMSQDPEELIKDAEAALITARQATDEQSKEQSYKMAARAYRAAYGRADTDSFREEILLKMADMYFETQEWPGILGCWDELVKVNPANAQARYCRLKYFYILADSGAHPRYWQDVQTQASEFLKVLKDSAVLAEDTSKWDTFFSTHVHTGRQRLGPYLYLLKGRAALEMASLGTVTNRDESLKQAVDDLKKVQELEPNNVDACWFLARAAVEKGEIAASRGNAEEKEKASRQAVAFLEQAIRIAGDSPTAHINLLMLKLRLARGSSVEALKEQLKSLEAEFLSLVQRFASSADAHAAASNFYSAYSAYSGPRLGSGILDKAVEAAEEAVNLDASNVAYSLTAAFLHYRRFSIYGRQTDIDRAEEIARNALALPDARDTPGPTRYIKRSNRYRLYALLGNCYIDQILASRQPRQSAQRQVWLDGLEQAVHQIEQLHGSAGDPRVVLWKGILKLAKGDKQAAVRELFSAYAELKSVKPSEPPWPPDPEFSQLSYTLAKTFMETSEIGAAKEFLISAIYSGIGEIKPQARLDYVDVVLKLEWWPDAMTNIEAFEEYFGSTARSRELRIRAYIGGRQFAEAERELAKGADDDPETIKLRLALTQAKIRHTRLVINQRKRQASSGADVDQFMTRELEEYRQVEASLLERLLVMEPNAVEEASMIDLCRHCVGLGKTDQAIDLINRFLERFPENAAALVYKLILAEPSPAEVSPQRLRQIEEQVLSGIADPIRLEVQLGIFYRGYNEPENATGHLRKALEMGTGRESIEDSALEHVTLAADHLFDIALGTENWKLGEEVVETARRANLDGCQGKVFATRLAAAKGDFKEALVRANECLEQKPVFSYGYMLRSSIYAALGNDHASMDDLRRAASFNPTDGTIARISANALYQRNQKLGGNVSPGQISEARDALLRAISLNPGDLGLLSLYADYIAETEPLKAIAIRQDLQQANPNIDNALLLGKLATEVAVKETGPESKEALFAIAGSAFEQARKMDPKDKRLLYYYAEYFRLRGQGEEARKLLEESQDEKLLWDHYFQAGQYEDAGRVLEQLYDRGTKDSGVLRGLLLVAERTSDREAVKKYSEGLISLENTADNNLAQIHSFLRVGLIREAEHKLQSFKERYPNDPRMLLLQGWLAMRKGQLDKALELANRNLQMDPDNAAAWRLKGEINFFREDYDSAIGNLRKSRLLSDEPATRIVLARTYMEKQRYDDAITELKTAAEAPGAAFEARSYLENIYLRLTRKQALEQLYEETVEKFPGSAHWLNRAADFALKTGQFDRAEQLYHKAFLVRRELNLRRDEGKEIQDGLYLAAFDGYLSALIVGAGKPNATNWNPEKLNQVFQECNAYSDGPLASVAFMRMAQAKAILGDRATAVEYCRKAVDKAGNNELLAADVLVRMYFIVGADEVSQYCSQKLQGNPNSLAANLAMFNLAKMGRDYSKAINYISKCIEAADGGSLLKVDFTVKKAGVLVLAYEESSDKNYIKTAIADYESLLSKMPNNTGVTVILNNLAYLLAENDERLSDALEYAKKTLDARPDDAGVLDTYAYVLLKNGKVSEAAEFLAASLQQYEQDRVNVPAGVYEHKGMIKEKLGAKPEALAAYKQALELGADRLPEKARQRIEDAIGRVSQ
ncbi:MAG: tetratricopeptide repeat protein [Planctomycetota bacterium]